LALQEREILMKKRLIAALSLVVIAVVVLSSFATIEDYRPSSAHVAAKKPFYVGVTFCGDSIADAEQLIDKVKDYTNLFVLQSGPLMQNITATEQIGDYAVNAGLNIILYYGKSGDLSTCVSLLNLAKARWGSHFLGLYYQDEPGGTMLDSQVSFNVDNSFGNVTANNEHISKGADGTILVSNIFSEGSNTTFINISFEPSGIINLQTSTTISTDSSTEPRSLSNSAPSSNRAIIALLSQGNSNFIDTSTVLTYYTNGTINCTFDNGTSTIGPLNYFPDGTVQYENGTYMTDEGNISQFESYQQLWESNPIQTYAEAANDFVNTEHVALTSIGNESDVRLFTSDFGLYWFDYLSGYNTVFAELFGTQTDSETLALVRGASDMQNKSWGVMIEPASQSPITLQTGDQIYGELQQAYEDGAEYGVVFNYAPNNTVGLLQDEQFAAIQKFWTDVVQSPKETDNVTAQDALVLPADYGWGMGSQNDTIWGLWRPDASSQQVWNSVQQSLAMYGSRLDIVYADPAYSTAGRYQRVSYWNQTA
jgi:hypothetical protein